MKVDLFFPYVADKPEIFIAFAERFARTYREFDPGIEHRLVVACCCGPLTPGVRALWAETNCLWTEYTAGGCDAGSAQFWARHTDADLIVPMTSRTYCWKAGWLKRLVEAFEKQGDGLLGVSASYEAQPHIRGCMYACPTKRYREYPHTISSRQECFYWEHGQWNFTKWFQSRKLPTKMVTWDGEYDQPDWRTPPNIFRRGDQTALLTWDKHSQIYAIADDKTKAVLEGNANGVHSGYRGNQK